MILFHNLQSFHPNTFQFFHYFIYYIVKLLCAISCYIETCYIEFECSQVYVHDAFGVIVFFVNRSERSSHRTRRYGMATLSQSRPHNHRAVFMNKLVTKHSTVISDALSPMWHHFNVTAWGHVAYQWIGSLLIPAIYCCLYGAKPLPESMLICCQFNNLKQF